jgi:drug/metabolite transporter (DMT)-like permease
MTEVRPEPVLSPGAVSGLTALVLVSFSANSLLARGALGPNLVDAVTFTAVRLGSGAVAMSLITLALRHSLPRGGSFGAALSMVVYAVAFSLAYRRVGAGPGALLLFVAVQATMVGWSVRTGARPTRRQWVGLGLALVGLGWLTLPGAHAPDPQGSLLMLVAGVAWGAYSLLGRGAADPLETTAGNFARSLVFVVPLVAVSAGHLHTSTTGVVLAAASGALASGVGYSLWYAAMPALGATRAAVVQLAVPVITPLGAALLLGEAVTPRLVVAGAAIVTGIALAVTRSRPAAR